MKQLLFLIAIVGLINSIYIPLSSNVEKCMVAFSFGQSETIKLELRFPQIPKQDEYGEEYTVSLKNSETNETQYENVKYGIFKR